MPGVSAGDAEGIVSTGPSVVSVTWQGYTKLEVPVVVDVELHASCLGGIRFLLICVPSQGNDGFVGGDITRITDTPGAQR